MGIRVWKDTLVPWNSYVIHHPHSFQTNQAEISNQHWENSACVGPFSTCGHPNYDNLRSMVVNHLSTAGKNDKNIGVTCIYLNHKEADQQPPKLLAGLWTSLYLTLCPSLEGVLE
jgi:hypothetical protein